MTKDEQIAMLREQACGHDWESGRWGVIVGVSRCRRCGRVSRAEDFDRAAAALAQPVKEEG